MAIARDAATDGGLTASTSKTYSHTVAAGSDRVLIVVVDWQGDYDAIATVTYNGVAMRRYSVVEGANGFAYVYILVNPDTGTHDIVITTDGTSDNIISYAVGYTGVHQTVPVDKIVSKENTGISSGSWNGASLTTRVTDSWGILVSNKTAGGTMSAGGGSNELADGDGFGLFDSNGALGAPDSESMNAFASDGTQNWCHTMLNIIPSGATLPTGILFHGVTIGNNGDFAHVHPASLTNDVLIVTVGTHQGVISGITYGGQAMTQLSLGSSSFDEDGSIWILLDPPTGSNTVDISRSGGSWHGAVAYSLSNVKQTTTVTQVSESGNESSPDINITPSTADNLIIAAVGAEAYTYTGKPMVGLGHLAGASHEAHGSQMIFQVGAAALYNVVFWLSSGQRYGLAVVALEPAPTASGPTNLKSKLGLAKASIKSFNGLAIASTKTVDGLN